MKALDAYLAEYVKDIVDPTGSMAGGGSGSSNPGGPVTGLTAFEENVPGHYSGTLNNVVDGDTNSALWYNDYGRVGQIIGVDLGRPVMVGTVTFTQNSGDHFSDYTLQYSLDGETWTDYKRYTDTVLTADLSADGIEARYIRFYNNASTSVWIKIHEIAVTEAAATTINTNNETASAWKTRVGNTTAELLTGGAATFAPGDYVGYDLRRIKDLDTITVADQGELTLQVSVNNVDWVTVDAGDVTENGRYVRLINLTDTDVAANITTFTVTANVYSGPYLLESNIGVNSSWGVSEDSRDNGAAFDGNVSTTTEFGDFVTTGQYFIYDLGQARDIYKLEIYCADSAVNYIRDAEMQISADLENWTTVLTIGDGVENTNEASVSCINSDAGYSQTTSSYPNFVSIEGELDEAQTARYIRVIMTAPNNERAVLFNEIEINDGEYVSVNSDLAFDVSHIEVQGYPPQNMVDGDLTTSWKPDTTGAGSMVYTFSDNLTNNRINIVSKSASGAKVYVYAENDGEREWSDMGTLDKSLVKLVCENDLNLALKIEWDAVSVPNITEIIRFFEGHEHSYTAVVTAPTCTEGGYTTYTCSCGDSYTADETPALGHDWDGIDCTRCDEKRENPFEDVPADSYYLESVLWAVENDITTGMTPTTFGPALDCNRAQVVTFLWRASGSPEPTNTVNPFADVPEDSFYYKAVLWAVEKGVTTGVSADHFNPSGQCNRAQVVTFLYRAYGQPELENRQNPFTDLDYNAYYMDAVLWAYHMNITGGISDTQFAPDQVCNRAQIVTFLYRTYAE